MRACLQGMLPGIYKERKTQASAFAAAGIITRQHHCHKENDMKKIIIFCDCCGEEISGPVMRFKRRKILNMGTDLEMDEETSEAETVKEKVVDNMDFCKDCFDEAIAYFVTMRGTRMEAPAKTQAATVAASTKEVNVTTAASAKKLNVTAAPSKKAAGPAQIYHDEIEIYLSQKKPTEWIAEKLNRYGVGYSIALDAVEAVRKEREKALIKKVVKK